jgi:sugar transferase (PEP-CTERM/EpsH1 system associated)
MQDLLFLAQRIPYPPNKGDKIRSFHILQDLCRHYRVHLGCFVDDDDDWRHLSMLRSMVASCRMLPLSKRNAKLRAMRALISQVPMSLPYYYDRRMDEWVEGVLTHRHPSTAYLFSSPMAQYLLPHPQPPRIVMDFVDVDSQKWTDYATSRQWPMSAVYRREGRLLLSFERKVAQFAAASIFVSEPEKALFGSLAPEATPHLHAVGNGIDTSYFSPDRDYPIVFRPSYPTLVFTGAMDYWPNVEAVRWFASIVLPLVRQNIPQAHFTIVGLNPTPEVIALGKLPGITVTGRVPDVRPYLAQAKVVVAPLLSARGIQNKVLEGMAMARPVVATSQALEGIVAIPGRHLLVADNAPDFADAVVRAITDPEATAMGLAARDQIERHYAWAPQLARLRKLIARDSLRDAA